MDNLPVLDGLLIDVNFNGQILDKADAFVRAEQIRSLIARRQEFFAIMKGTLNASGL